MEKMVAKFSQKFTVQNCNSKASPGETHSGAKKTARTPENIEAVWVGGCERRIVRQSQPLAQRRRGGDTTSWAAIKYHDKEKETFIGQIKQCDFLFFIHVILISIQENKIETWFFKWFNF